MQTWGSITGIHHALLLVLVLPVFLSCIAGKLQREVADQVSVFDIQLLHVQCKLVSAS